MQIKEHSERRVVQAKRWLAKGSVASAVVYGAESKRPARWWTTAGRLAALCCELPKQSTTLIHFLCGKGSQVPNSSHRHCNDSQSQSTNARWPLIRRLYSRCLPVWSSSICGMCMQGLSYSRSKQEEKMQRQKVLSVEFFKKVLDSVKYGAHALPLPWSGVLLSVTVVAVLRRLCCVVPLFHVKKL